MGKSPPPAAPLGGANPRNFWRFVLILIEQRKYKNAIEQSVGSVPGIPRWLILSTRGIGANGNFATARPSKSELRRPKTTKRTAATTAPDLNLESERSRVDSLRLVSTRSIFLAREDEDDDKEVEEVDFPEEAAEEAEEEVDFMDSSFLEALSMVERRDL